MPDDGGLLIRRGGEGSPWRAPASTAYDAEAHLQSVLAGSPGWLPGVSDEAWTVQELATSGGYVDVCVVDTDGRITVVECKLASNSEKRRMVVGQVIDYAAALWRDGDSAFLDAWQRVGGPDLTQALTADALSALRSHLDRGTVNLCLAVDQIDSELRRLVEFLNRLTLPQVSVTAVQLSYARDGDLEILIPSTFGGEIADAKVAPSARKDHGTVDSFLEALADPSDRALAEWLFERVTSTGPGLTTSDLFWFGTRPGGGVYLRPFGGRYSPLQLWVNSAHALMVYGNWNQYEAVRSHPGFAELASLLGQDHLGPQRSVPAAALPRDALWAVVSRCAQEINSPSPDLSSSDLAAERSI
jgi:hypothetical protein